MGVAVSLVDMLLPISHMRTRLANAKATNESEHFNDLLLSGEMLTKLAVAMLLAATDEDTERHVHRTEWSLVRADSLGKWADAARDLLTGPLATLVAPPARVTIDEITPPTGDLKVWYRTAVVSLHKALASLYPDVDKLPRRSTFVHWLLMFSELRNKTKGHGAPLPHRRSEAIPLLEESIGVVAAECPLFQWDGFYAEEQLSGSWVVVPLSDDAEDPDVDKRDIVEGAGAYLALERPRPIRLMFTTTHRDDFWFPNGGFKDKRQVFEVLSYATGDVDFRDGRAYAGVPAPLPTSTTAATGQLEGRGSIFTNSPGKFAGYIHRPNLERELGDVIRNEHRHPVVTLVGRGGIGKTSLALELIDSLVKDDRFFLIVWFSSRDIDLLDSGPKKVAPDVLSLVDVAKVYQRVVGRSSTASAIDMMAEDLADASAGGTLFVFDNFETIQKPDELFRFVDERIRPPNKVLITTRHRSFKGDYPIEVGGMEEAECRKLIRDQAERLAVLDLLTEQYQRELIAESEGHPYVIKILLGEVAKERRLRKVERIVASQDEILDALFDRTFISLSEAARRVFLTLSAWRSTVPVVAVEAVLLRNPDERIPIQQAVEELERYSFVEVVESEGDGHLFISVPLAASIFGRRRLVVSHERAAVEADVALLRAFGVGQKTDVQHGIGPRVLKMFRFIAQEIDGGRVQLADVEPMLQFLARRWPEAWLHLATLRSEAAADGDPEGQKQALRSYLEVSKGIDALPAWKQLALACKYDGDLLGEVHAWAELASTDDVPLEEISRAANRVNAIFRENKGIAPTDERGILLRRFADVMAHRLTEANANDLSRLAWLYIQLHDTRRAREVAVRGLEREPDNIHCQRILERIDSQPS